MENTMDVIVLIAANAEWKTVNTFYRDPTVNATPFGECFTHKLANHRVLFFHCGWGKISAAASTQYAISTWQPKLLINIGTCGGISGCVDVGEVLLANETLVYDIYERMGDPAEAIDFYRTSLDLTFLCEPLPQKVRVGRLVSADQDIDPDLVHKIKEDFDAIAADWESGAIAWTAARNKTKLLILRGVSDLVNSYEGEIYNSREFTKRAEKVMLPLLKALPNWIRCAFWGNSL